MKRKSLKKLVANKLLNKGFEAKFTKDCPTCAHKNLCISASRLNAEPRKYLLYAKGIKEPVNEAMIKGKKAHEKATKKIKSLEEYGYEKFVKDLKRGKKITLKEVSFCNPNLGHRGIIDILQIKIKGKKADIEIIELKSTWSKKHFIQLITYGLMLADPTCRIFEEVKKNKRVGHNLYEDKLYNRNITVTLQIIKKEPKKYIFMKNNIMEEWAKGVYMGITRKGKILRDLHKRNFYDVTEVPPCNTCWENCGYHKICDRIPAKDGGKELQMYFGKRQLLVKTKPQVNLAKVP